MKKLLAMGILAVSLSTGVVAQSARADEADTAAKNEKRAEGQEFKAEKAAARGNTYDAAKHIDNERRDEHKARREERHAIRKGEVY